MPTKSLAHLSDLHIGRSWRDDRAADKLCQALITSEVDHVVITGDLTHGGRVSEMRRFWEIFQPLASREKLSVIPGNHDRLRDDPGRALTIGRAAAEHLDGLYLVKVDSTGPHNHSILAGHGELNAHLVDEIEALLRRAPAGALRAILIHHHLLPLPVETFVEWFADTMRWPFAYELSLGQQLLTRAVGLCDLVLHGHRHVPREVCFAPGPQALRVYNAGSSTELCGYRVFDHADGRLLGAPSWVELSAVARRPWRRPQVTIASPLVLE